MIDVTAVIIKKDGKFFIAQRKKGDHKEGMWEFPGGKIEPRETPKEYLKRELQEEFHIESSIGEFFGESIFDYGEKKIRLLGYWAKISGKIISINSHEKIAWISPKNFDKYDFAPADIPFVKKLQRLNGKG